MTNPHHDGSTFLLEEGAVVRIPRSVVKYFVRAQKRRVKIEDTLVLQPRVARVRKEGNTGIFLDYRPQQGGLFNVFMPDGVKGGDELYVLWVDSNCACMVNAQQWKGLRGRLPKSSYEDRPRGECMVAD